MPQQAMMAAMGAGMAATPLMPASTPPALAMRGYDLGAVQGIGGVKGGIQFDGFR